MRQCHLAGIAAVVLMTALLSESRAYDKQPPAKAVNAAAAALIDKFKDVAEVDTGYSPYVSGSAFAPLSDSDRVQVVVLFQRPSQTSDTFCELVKLGPAAVPDLVAHLNDNRPTKMNIVSFGTLEINKPDKDDKPGAYTLKVGDLCYVALGQIVNRDYGAVSYIPSGIVIVHTPTRDLEICGDLKKEWGDLTPDKHRKSLLKDCEGKDAECNRTGAFLRLAWYYPDALEAPALKFLATPTYSKQEVEAFVRNKLYATTDAKTRRDLFDAYVKECGVAGRDGIRRKLYSDLCNLERIEEFKLNPEEFGEKPRLLLIELYGAPKTVKWQDEPLAESITENHLAEVIEYGLSYDRSTKIDRAVRDILAKTTDATVAQACTKRLVGRGYDKEIEAYYRRYEKDRTFSEAGWTPLHVAVSRRQQERLTELLREGAKVNAAAKDGCIPLHEAAAVGNAPAIKLLLDAGADQKAMDKHGRTPVGMAAFRGNTEAVRQLVAAGGPISDIFVAATMGKTEEVAAFLRKDKELLQARDFAYFTPLHRATAEGHLKVMQELLDAGAEVDPYGGELQDMTPLDMAAALGRADACALLIKGKAKIDGPGRQPIHYAAGEGHLDVIKLLVEKDAKVDARDGLEWTPLHCAALHGHLAVVKWLVEHKADVNAKNKDGFTPLDLANEHEEHADVAEFLSKNGAKSKSD